MRLDPQSLPRAENLTRLPVVAIVGRPNTGKSTLFNRLTRSRRALVAPTPGVTRDRNIAVAEHRGRRLLVVDTGGFEADQQAELAQAVRTQALLAAQEADAVIAVLDGRAGLNPLDRLLMERLRPLRQPVLVAVNKLDTPAQLALVDEFYALGAARLFPLSAEHGLGVDTLLDAAFESLPAPGEEAADEEGNPALAVAIIGRPNVGKSSLLNRLVGFERAIVSPAPGTTRDALDTSVTRDGHAYLLVDTAGIRRRPRVHEHLERASVVRALRALERAEVALLVVDASEGLAEQDARIAGYAWERGRALVLVLNKCDAVPRLAADATGLCARLVERFPSLASVPKLLVSARTGRGVERIWAAIDAVAAAHRRRLPTAKLNAVIGAAARAQAPPMMAGVRPKLFYAAQTATAPPTITVFCHAPERLAASYQRFLLNQVRAAFALDGVPVRLRFTARPRRGRGPDRAARSRR
jgi:GTP-binding protein